MRGESATSAGGPGEHPGAIRVMLVDDSAVIRGILARVLEADPGIRVVRSVSNGQMAIDCLKHSTVDIILLDVEMPVMDGLTALPHLLKAAPEARIIMASTLTTRNAEISLQAMRLGAADYIPKPSSADMRDATDAVETFRTELLAKVRALGGNRRRSGAGATTGLQPPTPAARSGTRESGGAPTSLALRHGRAARPEILAIASSTGGPQALCAFFGTLDKSINVPILIVQHMPPMFTAILAEHVGRTAARPCREAADREEITPGTILVAPGGYHMLVRTEGSKRVLRLTKDPPENFCRPSADPLFRSLAATYGAGTLAVVLTGIGNDGLNGSLTITDIGGTVIAQDEASSVVWGMPGAVAKAGICRAVLPPTELARHVAGLLRVC